MKILIVSILTFFFAFFTTPTKKDNLLLISRQYFPDNYVLLNDYAEVFVNQLARGDSLSDYVFGLTTIMHEAYHVYDVNLNWADTVRKYRLNDTLTIAIEKTKSFACVELNNIASLQDRKQIFRYDTYIGNADPSHDTQQNGFLGLLAEYVAYYHEFKTYNAMYKFLKNKYKWEDAEMWRKYLCEISSVKYSPYEFKLFISWYLQYAKIKYPNLYSRIITDKNIRKLYTYINKENNKMIKEFELNRKEIIKNLGQRIKIQNDFLTVIKSGNSNGLNDIQEKKTLIVLSKPEHKILNELMD